MMKMIQTDCRRAICLILLGWLVFLAVPGEAAPQIEKIVPVVKVADGSALPVQIINRMQAGVRTIADNRLAGRNVSMSFEERNQEERLIRDVFERILNGYTVNKVEIVPGTEAVVTATITPWFNTIQQVNTDLQINNVSPLIRELIVSDLTGIQSQLAGVMIGLPIDAVDWSYGIIRGIIQEKLAASLPEYQVSIEITGGRTTTVKLNLYPKGAIIRHITNTFSSETVPNLLMLEYRPYMQKKTEQLVGLPIEFVKRHQVFLEQRFNEQLQQDNKLVKYDVQTHISFEIADNSIIRTTADTQKYRVSLEGYTDIGRKEDNLYLKLHTGSMMNERWEYYLETTLQPHNMEWRFAPGLAYDLSAQARGGVRYDLTDADSVFWIKQKAGEKWLWQLEYVPHQDKSEVSLRYRLQEFIGIEYVVSSDQRWLRMIGYF